MTLSQLIIVTDLDGTLLDHESYGYQASWPAVQRLKSRKIPLILCSSKTAKEITALWNELGLTDPFVAENGGAVYLPPRYFPFLIPGMTSEGLFEVLELGARVTLLRRALEETARKCGTRIRSFGGMTLDEICALTGLTRERGSLAAERQYDEPFLVEAEDRERLFAALREKGLEVTRGDRFFHLTGGHGKGEAVKLLLDFYRRRDGAVVSIGLGNSANDLPLLRAVDRPILVRNPDGTYDPEVTKTIPWVERTMDIGPRGWNEIVSEILFRTDSQTNK